MSLNFQTKNLKPLMCCRHVCSTVVCIKDGKASFLRFWKNTKNTFFVGFWDYVGQPHDLISWAVPMPFASINSTIPRTDPWEFHEKILRIGGAGKWGFFEAAILNFLSRPFWNFFCFISVKTPAHLYEVSFFLHYGWFFQNLGKEGSRTFMHTTVRWSWVWHFWKVTVHQSVWSRYLL